jgi:hypothetical protein
VALKVLRDDLRNNEHVVARFRREAEAFARLNHPNIVRIYAVGVVGKIPFIAMELIDGEPLNQRLSRTGPMPWKDTLDIGLQLADALAAAHEHGVIHRDIKPGNILLGRNGRVYLTDFGIAKVLGATTQLTMDGARLGTPQYLCPERCRNEAVTPASDLYSLGVVLFQTISGRLPFEAANSVELIRKIAGEVPARLSTYVPDIPEPVDRFLAHVLDPDASQRPQDARALRSLIARVRSGEALDAGVDDRISGLAALRESMPVVVKPTPAKQRAEQGDWRRRSAKAWYRLPRALRLALPAAVALLLAGTAYLMYSARPAARIAGFSPVTAAQAELAWKVPDGLLRYQPETDTVGSLITDVPYLTVELLHPVAGGQRILIVVAGESGSPLAGRRGLWRYDPVAQRTEVVVPLLPATTEADFHVLASWRGDSVNGERYLLNTPAGVWSLAESYAAKSPFASGPVQGAAVAAASGHLLLSAPEVAGVRLLDLAQPTLPERMVPLAVKVGPVCALAPDAGRVAFLESTGGGGLSTLTLQPLLATAPARELSANVHSLSPQAFAADGRRLVAGVQGEMGSHAHVIDTESVRPPQDLGPGSAPLWAPGGEAILALAPDYAGRMQVWRLSVGSEVTREQLSYVGAGVGDTLVVNGDGSCALSTQPGGTRVVVVAL